MRIAQLTYSYQPITGGADAYADLLCTALRERGHEVHVYQRHAGAHDPFVHQAPRFGRWVGVREYWLIPYWLRSRRAELKACDVLIGHYPNYCVPGYFHPRLVGLSHGVTWDDYPEARRSRIKRDMARRAFGRCARFVANDTFFLREMGLEVPPGATPFAEVAPGRWFVPNCVDTDHFSPAGADAAPRAPNVILVPRNLYRNRGVHLAVQALGLLAGEWPELELDIAGAESQPEYAAEVRGLIAQLGLEARVRFVGSVPWPEMPALYRGAALCLIPSLCGEGTSLAALEAMACATATITTDIGGLPDLPAEHCAPTAEALAAKIAEVLPRAAELGAQQREVVASQFHLGRWKAAWTRVVEEWG